MSEYIPLIISALSDCILAWFTSDVGLVFCGVIVVAVLVRVIFAFFSNRF